MVHASSGYKGEHSLVLLFLNGGKSIASFRYKRRRTNRERRTPVLVISEVLRSGSSHSPTRNLSGSGSLREGSFPQFPSPCPTSSDVPSPHILPFSHHLPVPPLSTPPPHLPPAPSQWQSSVVENSSHHTLVPPLHHSPIQPSTPMNHPKSADLSRWSSNFRTFVRMVG